MFLKSLSVLNKMLKCKHFTGEHPCQSIISIKFLCNFIEMALHHGCSPVNLLHIFSTSFRKNNSGRLLLEFYTLLTNLRQISHHMEISKLIYKSNQLTGFHMSRT